MSTERLIDYLKTYAIVNVALGFVAAALFAIDVEPLRYALGGAVVLIMSAAVTSAVIHVIASTAETVRHLERSQRQAREELHQGLASQRRVTELETENAELRVIAQAALDQRDAVG